jgi:hypothetical protein
MTTSLPLAPTTDIKLERTIWADRLAVATNVGSWVSNTGHAFSADELRGIVAEFDSVIATESSAAFAGLTASQPTPYFN